MDPDKIVALRFLLVLFLIGTVLTQVLVLPICADDVATMNPEFAYAKLPYLIACIGVVGAVQAGVVCLWRLLSLVERDEIFAGGLCTGIVALLVVVLRALLRKAATMDADLAEVV